MNLVEHHGYQIPRKLAVKTGTLPDFTAVSDHHIQLLEKYGDLHSSMNVLEIGCGVGRDAITLSRVLSSEGSYIGIDIIRESINWAAENIALPNFKFVHFDVSDQQHNPRGTGSMRDYQVPSENSSADLVFLFSVFTHMFPGDVSKYLREFSRVMKPHAKAVASMFVVNREVQKHLISIGGGGLRKLTFAHEVEPGFFHNDPDVVPGATGYSRERIEIMAKDAGLILHRVAKGSWSREGHFEIQGQDLIVFQKP